MISTETPNLNTALSCLVLPHRRDLSVSFRLPVICSGLNQHTSGDRVLDPSLQEVEQAVKCARRVTTEEQHATQQMDELE